MYTRSPTRRIGAPIARNRAYRSLGDIRQGIVAPAPPPVAPPNPTPGPWSGPGPISEVDTRYMPLVQIGTGFGAPGPTPTYPLPPPVPPTVIDDPSSNTGDTVTTAAPPWSIVVDPGVPSGTAPSSAPAAAPFPWLLAGGAAAVLYFLLKE